MVGNHSYVADVTPFVPIGGHLNQDYQVVFHFDAETSTTGQNPWGSVEAQKVRAEGATLIIVYRTQDTTGSVFVYDALNNSMFSGTAQFDLLHPNLGGAGRFTMVGALSLGPGVGLPDASVTGSHRAEGFRNCAAQARTCPRVTRFLRC